MRWRNCKSDNEKDVQGVRVVALKERLSFTMNKLFLWGTSNCNLMYQIAFWVHEHWRHIKVCHQCTPYAQNHYQVWKPNPKSISIFFVISIIIITLCIFKLRNQTIMKVQGYRFDRFTLLNSLGRTWTSWT